MKLCLLGKEKLDYITLPKTVEDNNFISKSFSCLEEYVFNFEGSNNKWYLYPSYGMAWVTEDFQNWKQGSLQTLPRTTLPW